MEKITDQINNKVSYLKKKFIIIDMEKHCDICKEKTFNGLFFYFHCNHHFHKFCLLKKFKEFGLKEKVKRIEELEIEKNRYFRLPSECILKRKSD